MHHSGYDTTEAQAESVVQCLHNANQDEDADDGGGGGGGNNRGGSGTWVWIPTETNEMCYSYGGDGTCTWVSTGGPDGNGYYDCGTIEYSEDYCWHEIVTPGHWIWVQL